MDNSRIISALIGLGGAIHNNGKTPGTDDVVRTALLGVDSDAAVAAIHREKYHISPNCETCPSPCGNTSDYDMSRLELAPAAVRRLKLEIIAALQDVAQRNAQPLPEIVYKAIAYLGYDMDEDAYQQLLEGLQQW